MCRKEERKRRRNKSTETKKAQSSLLPPPARDYEHEREPPLHVTARSGVPVSVRRGAARIRLRCVGSHGRYEGGERRTAGPPECVCVCVATGGGGAPLLTSQGECTQRESYTPGSSRSASAAPPSPSPKPHPPRDRCLHQTAASGLTQSREIK